MFNMQELYQPTGLQEKKADVYRALAQLNRWAYDKYKDDETVKIPYCRNVEDLDRWIKKACKPNSVAEKCYDKPVRGKALNLSYSEALSLFDLILSDREITDKSFDIGWEAKTHKIFRVNVSDHMYGIICISRFYDNIIITVNKGNEGDVDIEFRTLPYESVLNEDGTITKVKLTDIEKLAIRVEEQDKKIEQLKISLEEMSRQIEELKAGARRGLL